MQLYLRRSFIVAVVLLVSLRTAYYLLLNFSFVFKATIIVILICICIELTVKQKEEKEKRDNITPNNNYCLLIIFIANKVLSGYKMRRIRKGEKNTMF